MLVQVDTADDIKRYENVLNKARSKVDFAIAEQVYMLPSDMLLKIGNIKGYNNNLLIANNSVKIGVVNQSVNSDVKHVIKPPIIHKTSTPPPISTPPMLPEKDKKLAVDHIEEKEVLIIVGYFSYSVCILFHLYIFFSIMPEFHIIISDMK